MKLHQILTAIYVILHHQGTFLHMFWECPVVISLWTHVNLVLSSLLQIDWLANPSFVFLMMILVSV